MAHYSLQHASGSMRSRRARGWPGVLLALTLLAILAWAWSQQQALESPLPQAGPPSSADSALA